MPDVTVSFTDAQWTRVVAASSQIKGMLNDGTDVDADYLAADFKKKIEAIVTRYEHAQASVSDF